jgi:hypothetical protein
MRPIACALSLVALCFSACTSSTEPPGKGLPGTTSSAASACAPGSPLTGASYDLTKSRFAFGSKPVEMTGNGYVRWVGSDGAALISSDGSEVATLNAGAPESMLPDWSSDSAALKAHAMAYWASMGVEACQVSGQDVNVTIGGGGPTDGGPQTMTVGPSSVILSRGIEGMSVVESLAVATFDSQDTTTQESFYWPEIPADVVSAALAFRQKLADPSALAAYRAKLPADAQGDGRVVIHHSHAGSTSTFQAVAVYDVVQSSPLGLGANLFFDANARPVTMTW